jgi:phage terminase large subunit GpA-like protein
VLEKTFPGGYLSVIGANSAAGLSMSPVRCAFFDEVDRFPKSAGTEGDPIELGAARTDTYGDLAIQVHFSTPADEPSRVDEAYQESDQRQYWVPCPLCGHEQFLQWRDADGDYRLIWEKDKHGHHLPETARYLCKACGGLIDEIDKPAMLSAGYWKPLKPEITDVAGFHCNVMVSPFFSWADMARMFLNVRGNPERLKTFVNLKLADVWDPEQWVFNDTKLAGRRERYHAEVPKPVGILTAGVDVQADRLELEVDGWGVGHESWTLTHERIYGDPVDGDVWEALEALLTKPWAHASGSTLRIMCCLIDSGYLADEVYGFVKPRQRRRVYAAKGLGGDHVQLVKRAQRPDRHRIRLVTVGTDTAKDKLFPRLAMEEPGPGYIHFGAPTDTGLDEEYFAQLKAEKIDYRTVRGRRVRYYKQIRKRNEAIDLKVLNLAAFHLLGAGVTDHMARWVDRANGTTSERASAPATKPRRGGVLSKGVEL